MADFILDGLTLEKATDFQDELIVVGGYNTTMLGNVRRAIRATKHRYILRWGLLTKTQYDSLKAKFDKKVPLTFSNSDLSISTTVHTDLTPREFLGGTGSDYLSTVEMVLTEI